MTSNRHFQKATKGWIALLALLLGVMGLPALAQAQDCSIHQVTLAPFDAVCANGEPFTLGGGSPSGGGVYFIDGVFATDFDPQFYGPGDYTITYEVYFPDGCVVGASEVLTVHPVTAVTFELPDEGYCAGQTQIALSGGTPAGGHYFGNYVVDGIFNASYSGAGTFEVYYGMTNTHGCYSQAADSITILQAPPAHAGADTVITAGTLAELQVQDADLTRYSYQWSPANLVVDPGAVSTNTIALYESVVFTLTVTDLSTDCQSTEEKVVFVQGGLLQILGIGASPASICAGEPVQLSVLPMGGSGNYSYQWTADPFLISDFDSHLRNPVAYPQESTLFTVTVTDKDDDTAAPLTESIQVDVRPAPEVTLNLEHPEVCGNDTVYVFSGGNPAGGYYSIPALNLYNITSINPSQLPEGQHQVTYTLPASGNACPGMDKQYLTIRPRVKASFYPQQDFCQMTEVTFLNLSKNASTFKWAIGDLNVYDGQPPPDPYEFFLDPGVDYDTTQVILQAWDAFGCSDEYVRDVVITRPTIAEFEVQQAPLSCAPHTVSFINKTTGPVGFYLWEFGDGSISGDKDPIHSFANNNKTDTTYTVTLTVMSANFFCTTYETIDITVHPRVSAGFSFTPPADCSPREVQFTDNATGALTYAWDFGNGETSLESDPVQLFENNTSDTLSYPVIQTVTNAAGCTDTAQKRVLVYPDHQPAFSTDVQEGCSPLEVTFQDQSTGVISGLVFDMGDGSTYTVSDTVHTFKNLTAAPVEYTVTLTTDNGFGCPKTFEQTITVYPELKADFTFSPASVCGGTLMPFTNTSSGHITRWQWDMGDTQVFDTRDIAPHLYGNAGADPITYTITLTAENDYCSESLSRELVVNPEVTADFDFSVPDPCDPLTVSLVNLSENAGTFRWELGDGNASGAHDLFHTYADAGNYTIKLFAQSDSLCADSIEKEITLDPLLKPDFNITEPAGCSPFTLSIENVSQGADSWQWLIDGVQVSDKQHPVLPDPIINNTGAVMQIPVTLIVSNAGGCTRQLERTITIYPEVTASFGSVIDDPENCHPLEVQFANTSSSHATSFKWDFENGDSSSEASPTHSFRNPSFTDPLDYLVTLTAASAYGCVGVATDIVTVNPRPVASFLLEDPKGCSPHEITLINQSEGALSYTWNYGDNTSDNNAQDRFTRTYTLLPEDQKQEYKVMLEAHNAFGCTDTLSQQVTVFPPVVAAFEADIVAGCHPLTVELTNLTRGPAGNMTYEWDYDDGSGSGEAAEKHSHTFTNNGATAKEYTVRLRATSPEGCSSSFEMVITVLPAPLTLFSVEDPIRCASPEITVENLSAAGASYLWDFDDGTAPEQIPGMTFTRTLALPATDEPGIFDIVLTATGANGCVGRYQQTVTVYPEVTASFTATENGCHPLEVEFTNTSSAGASVLWDLGDGSQSQKNSLSHVYFNHSNDLPEEYQVTLTATSPYGCEATHEQTITVYPAPLAEFSLESDNGCTPFETQVFNLSPGDDTFTWDMGNETFMRQEREFSHAWINTGVEPQDVTLMLTAQNSYGCEAQAIQIIKVFPQVQADFTTGDGLFEGCSPFTVQFENQSSGGQGLHWDFGDGHSATGSQPLHVFYAPGDEPAVLPVTLTATSAFHCQDVIQKDITVYPSPTAAFKAAPIVQTFPNTTVTLENQSSPGNWTYLWNFDDGQQLTTASREPITHQYDVNGEATQTYNIVLTTHNDHCSSTSSQQVTITTPVPVARFIPEAQGCAPLHVEFMNLSENAHSYQWFFGDGGVSAEKNPSYTFYDHGTYPVRMVATGDGGSSETTQTITVFENPVASFRLSDPLLEVGQALAVVNQSQGADFWSWDFGDGNHSSEFEPEHIYQQQGTYTITLVASTTNACRDTLSLVNGLRVQEPCNIYFPNAFKPDPSGPSGGSYTRGDPNNTVFYPVYKGLEDYTLEIFNRWGELIFRSNDPLIGWDGYVQGRLAKMDVYVWRFSGRCQTGKIISMTGDVTLYR